MYIIIAYCFANSFISVTCGCLLLAERLFIISRNDTKKIIELLNMLIFATAMPLLAGSKLVIIFKKQGIMEKWICTVCGYTHHGDKAPETCPKCGASKSQFHREGNGNWFLYAFICFIVIIAIALSFYSCSSSSTVDNSSVNMIDLNRYLGKWYEVARYDHRFERGMKQCTAIYTMQGDRTIKVTNKGMKAGKWKTSVGKAKLTEIPGVLRVSFFGPFYSDYRIMMLDSEYTYALVGGSSDDYLWILSRTPQLQKDASDKILQEARRRGYDVEKLIWVEQSKN